MIKEGTLGKVIFNNNENGYTVAIFNTDEGSIRIAGSFNEAKSGTKYKLDGKFTVHPKYGEQFSFSDYEEIQPEGREAIYEFLAAGNIRGIGLKNAKLIIDTFGDESLNVIEKTPEKLLEIKGIGKSTLEKITKSYLETMEFAKISLELRELGIEMTHAVKIYKMYAADSCEIVRENPYTLVDDIYGITFHKADLIAEKLGFNSNSKFRIASGIKYVLKTWAVSGSTLMPEKLLVEKVVSLLDTQSDLVKEELREMSFAGELQTDVANGEAVVYLYGYYQAEQRVASNIKRLISAKRQPLPINVDNILESGEISLSEEQKKAIKASLLDNVTIITGGPGTGKTTIINYLVMIFKTLNLKVALAAPTGRAAKRMEEASGESAMTIHRLLEYVYSPDDEEMYFGRNEENKLDYSVIIVDEASMIDIMLMDALLAAIKSGTILIITGDVDQLPSVGAGNVLKDIINSEIVYTARLKEIFRQSQNSRIVTNAHLINSGEFPELGGDESNFFFIERNNEEDVIKEIKGLIGGRLERHYDYVSSEEDIQILTPTKKGLLGALNLNLEFQSMLNPQRDDLNEIKIHGKLFREGDKVMQLKNDYMAKWRDISTFEEGSGIFNGDMGTIQYINSEEKRILVKMDDKEVLYEGEMLEKLDLAYSITVHKSQGSEFPVVIIPMWQCPPMLMTKNLIYTAVTRAKNLVILVGRHRYLKIMIENNREDERYTGLQHRLCENDLKF